MAPAGVSSRLEGAIPPASIGAVGTKCPGGPFLFGEMEQELFMSAADPTAAEMLTAVNVAIKAIVDKKVASLSINGRALANLGLAELYRMRRDLTTEIRTSGGNVGFGLHVLKAGDAK